MPTITFNFTFLSVHVFVDYSDTIFLAALSTSTSSSTNHLIFDRAGN